VAKKTAKTECTPETDTRPMMTGSDIVVKVLMDAGVDTIFAYPGGASMPLHQSFTQVRDKLRVILPRHEQGGGFAAQGYSRSTGKLGVCCATSGPGATNLVTTIADAKLDSIPMLFLSGQVGTSVIGCDAFQETPMVEVCRSITKHHYLVTDPKDLARVVREAIHIATTGRPGPVLIDLPKNVQMATIPADFDEPLNLPGYNGDLPKADAASIEAIAQAIREAKQPVIYAGGGVVNGEAAPELAELIEKTGIPVALTLLGLSAFPGDEPLNLGMLGMHGTHYSNVAVSEADLLLAFGVRFDDRVTGNVAEFAKHGKIVHIDLDPSEIDKIKVADIPVISDIKYALGELNKIVERPEIEPWKKQVATWKKDMALTYPKDVEHIVPQFAIEELSRLTKDLDPIIATGVGQHQMWSAQYFSLKSPRTWLTSGGLGTMGFGLPAAIGAKVANPDRLVFDIDGDGSFQMNIQELGTCWCEKIPVKVMILNNQHLGMVMQWEDRFHESNRGHTYLGAIHRPETFGKGEGLRPDEDYPDFCTIAQGYGWASRRVNDKSELADAIQEMIDSPEPFLLDVAVTYREHVLPMIPSGATVNEIIIE